MVYRLGPRHTIYGVRPMTAYISSEYTTPKKDRCNLLLLLLFLTGVLLGCLFVWHFSLRGQINGEAAQGQALFLSRQQFFAVLLRNAKFLLVIYLLSFSKLGALLIPVQFGIEGLLLGSVFGSVIAQEGLIGALSLFLIYFFRLSAVLPYGFLLGTWGVEKSLRFGETGFDWRFPIGILLLTLVVLIMSSFLECTLARWLGCMYFMKFGE